MRLPALRSLAPVTVTLLCAALLALPLDARADPVAQLKSALQRYSGQSAIKARLSAQVWSKNGEGSDATTESGQASLVAELGAFGLRLTYGADLLAKMAAEDDLRERDPKVRPATSTTLAAIDQGTVQEVLHAAPDLTRLLRRATLKSETAEQFNGQPARKLAFELGPPPMSERERKYVNKMDGTLDVWIAPDGTPLGHKMRSNVAGRAFVVISFEARSEVDVSYTVAGDRLVVARREARNSGSGAGERGESRRVVTTTVLPN
jgi:hypothetical protein